MRKSVIKYKGSLTWLIVISISLLIIGLLYFLGFNKIEYEGYYPQPPSKSLYGITPYAFYALGFYLLLIGLLLVLPTLNKGNRTSLKKNKLLYLIITINGLEIIIYSIFINLNLLPVLDPDHNWFGYFLVGFFVFFIGYMLVIFANDDFTELANYRNRLSFIVSFGVLIIIISLFTYWGLMRAFTISPNEWPPILMCGVLFLIIGGSPLLITRLTNNKSLSKTFVQQFKCERLIFSTFPNNHIPETIHLDKFRINICKDIKIVIKCFDVSFARRLSTISLKSTQP